MCLEVSPVAANIAFYDMARSVLCSVCIGDGCLAANHCQHSPSATGSEDGKLPFTRPYHARLTADFTSPCFVGMVATAKFV